MNMNIGMPETGILSCSDWVTIDQPLIDRFADTISDHQFIHVDPVRAKSEGGWGGTIAHGFLVLSLLSHFTATALPAPAEGTVEINYGLDKVRFLSPVRCGARIRGVFALKSLEPKGEGLLRRLEARVEIEGGDRPALIADWLVLVRKGEKA